MLAYIDLWTGLSGDMIVGALLDAGWSEEAMREVLAQLAIGQVSVTVERRTQHGIVGRGIQVTALGDLPARSHREVRKILLESSLSEQTRNRSIELFARLAEVEGSIHGVDPQEVHFHELGAVDSIVDIVLTVAGLEALGIDRLLAGPVPISRGEIETAHGRLPVPAPATLRLLEGLPIHWLEIEGEWLTPTGALFLSTLVESFGPVPPFHLVRTGIGAGSRQTSDRPNIVRILIGQEEVIDRTRVEYISVIETNIDDLDPRQQAEIAERLLQAGALDVHRTSISMKKGRTGTLFTILCRNEKAQELGDLLLQQSTALGIRIRRECRRELVRWVETVSTAYGPVRIKWSRPGPLPRPVPEFEDLRTLARNAGVPVWEVERAALCAAEVDRAEPPFPPAS